MEKLVLHLCQHLKAVKATLASYATCTPLKHVSLPLLLSDEGGTDYSLSY